MGPRYLLVGFESGQWRKIFATDPLKSVVIEDYSALEVVDGSVSSVC